MNPVPFIFKLVVESRVWEESGNTRAVYITLLSLADAVGVAHVGDYQLMKRCGLTGEELMASMRRLLSPVDSGCIRLRHGGRLIERVDETGWRILDWDTMLAQYQRVYTMQYMRQKRERIRYEKEGKLNGAAGSEVPASAEEHAGP